jgi:Flp pilus assembly protein TadD
LQLLQKNFTGARRSYEKALSLDQRDVESLAGLVQVALATNRPKEATALVAKAVERDASVANVQLLAARTSLSVGDTVAAERALRRTIELDPSVVEAYSMLGGLFVLQRRLEEARREFERFVAQQPGSVGAHMLLGTVLEALQKPAEAEQAYKAALRIDPQAPLAANNLAWMYVSAGRDLHVAFELAQAAKRRAPDNPSVNDTLGWVLYKRGLFEQAERALSDSLVKNPGNPGTQYRLGMTYVQLGDEARARSHLQQALKLSGTFDGVEEAKTALARLDKRR